MGIYEFVVVPVEQMDGLENENKELQATVDGMAEAITDLEKENAGLGDVFDAVSLDYSNLSERVGVAIQDLQTLTEVPINQLEDCIDSIVELLRKGR